MSAPTDRNQLVQQLNFWGRDASNEAAALLAALKLGLFDALPKEGEPGLSVDAVAARIESSPRGVRALLEPFLALGLICADEQWRVSLRGPVQEALSSEALRAAGKNASDGWLAFGQLGTALKTGAPVEEGGKRWDLLALLEAVFFGEAPDSTPTGRDLYDRFARNPLRTRVLIEAALSGLLGRLSAEPQSSNALAEPLGLSPRAVATMLRVLAQLGILEESPAGARFTPAAEEILGPPPSRRYFVSALPAMAIYWEALGRLDEAVRHERFVLDLRDPEASQRVYASTASRLTAIFASHLQLGKRAVALLQKGRPFAGLEVLDVGSGSGVWGAAFAMADPSVRATFIDRPWVLEQVAKNLEKLKLTERSKLWPADWLTADYGQARFDLVLLPHLTAISPKDVDAWVAGLERALKPGGLLLIASYVLTDRRDGPIDALYFSLRRYMTNEGAALSMGDFRALFARHRLNAVRRYPLPAQDLVIVGRTEESLPPEG